MAKRPLKSTSTGLYWLLAIAAVVAAIVLLDDDRVPDQQATGDDERLSKERAWIDKGKAAVTARLKDPESAQFRNVYFHQNPGEPPMTCGEVNAKNSLGGYPGFVHFISAGKPELTFVENDVDDFAKLWNQFCADPE